VGCAGLRWLTPRTADQESAEPGLVLLPPSIAPATGPSTTDDTLKARLRTWLSVDPVRQTRRWPSHPEATRSIFRTRLINLDQPGQPG
jgi:hypothetical protein